MAKLQSKLGAGGPSLDPSQNRNLDEAIQLKEAGKFEQAIELLENLEQHFPEEVALLTLLSNCLLLNGQLGTAKLYFDKAKKIAPNTAAVGWNASRIALMEKKPSQALNIARHTNQRFPDDVEGMGILGICLSATGEISESIKYLNQSIDLNNNNAEALINRGLIFLKQGKKIEALADLEKGYLLKPHIKEIWDFVIGLKIQAEQYSDAISLLLDMIERDPDKENAYSLLTACNQKANDSALAVKSFEKVLDVRPGNASMHVNLGIALKTQGKIEAASKNFKKALEIEPNDADAYYHLGATLKQQGKLEVAVAAYAKAIQIKPNYAEAHFNIGKALKEQGKLDDAIAAYNDALSAKPEYAEAYNNIGNILSEKGQHKEAINNYKKALALKPNNVAAYNNLGISYYDQGQLENAIKAFNNALVLEPDFYDAWDNLVFSIQAMKLTTSSVDELLNYYPKNLNSEKYPMNLSVLNHAVKLGSNQAKQSLNEALKIINTHRNTVLKNKKDVSEVPSNKSKTIDKVVALIHWGRSGTGLLHSLIDGHPEVSTLPSIYMSEYFHPSTWDGIISNGWNHIVDSFMAKYDVIFDAASTVPVPSKGQIINYNIGRSEGRTSVGDHRNQVLKVDRELFRTELQSLMRSHDQLDAFIFFKLIHSAYEKAIGNRHQKKLIFYHIHNPSTQAQLNFVQSVKKSTWVMMVREPLQSCESWLARHYEQNDYPSIVTRISAMLSEIDNVIYSNQNAIGVRLEDLKECPRSTIPALCHWLEIEDDDCLYKMTAQGKKWWGDPSSPDFDQDGMRPFGKRSISRKIGSIFSNNDQYILKTLFYPFSARFNYVETNVEQFANDIQMIRPMLDQMFDFEKNIAKKTHVLPEQFMTSGSYSFLRSVLVERWETLEKFGTYPNMISPLSI